MSGDAGYHRVFWLTTAFTVLVIAIVVLVVPATTAQPRRARSTGWAPRAWRRGCRRSCWRSPRAQSWGWTSPRTLACAACGVVVLVGWWLWERRAKQPLVSTEMLARRPILLTNLATVFVGMGLYFAFLGLTQFVQIPREAAGYGFGATVLEASVVYLLPGALTGFLVALVSGRFIDRFGARPVLVVAAAAGIAGFLFIALAHSAAVAGHRGQHPGQRLHQPRLRRAARAGGQRGRGGRDRCRHEHERDRPHDRQLHRRRPGRGAAGPTRSAARACRWRAASSRSSSAAPRPPRWRWCSSRCRGSGRAAVETVEARYESRAMNHEWG